MTQLTEVRKERGIPQPLGKALGFSTFSTGPTAAVTYNGALFQRQRSTLEMPISCRKDEEYFKLQVSASPDNLRERGDSSLVPEQKPAIRFHRTS